jgi:hypothetical protein
MESFPRANMPGEILARLGSNVGFAAFSRKLAGYPLGNTEKFLSRQAEGVPQGEPHPESVPVSM